MTPPPRLKPQTARTLALLRQCPEGITPQRAREHGCGDRLAARVWELRHLFGIDVRERRIVVPTRGGQARVACYYLEDAKPQQLAWVS